MPSAKGTRRTCSRGHVFYKSSDCPVCPTCWSGYYRAHPKNDFPYGLSAPAIRALLGAKIKTLEQLRRRTERDIADLHGIGPKGIRLLKVEMKKRGLGFKQEKAAQTRGGPKKE